MDPTEPPESSEEERWRTVRPVPNWRQQTKRGLLSRYPRLGLGLVVLLAAGAALAVFGALRSGGRKSAGGAGGGGVQVGGGGRPSPRPAAPPRPQAGTGGHPPLAP